MTISKCSIPMVALAICICSANGQSAEPIIWDGPAVTFTKEAFADWTLPENQDRITDNVWITRGDTKGLFNAAVEGFPADLPNPGPTGTEWAEGMLSDGIENLSFDTWLAAVNQFPPGSVGTTYVVHLVEDNIFLELRFDDWGRTSAGGGSFAYTRTTAPAPIPEPASVVLLALAGGGLWVAWRR